LGVSPNPSLGDALLQYQRCAAVLAQELSLAPISGTQELLPQINGT
jgi:hypothetical protein